MRWVIRLLGGLLVLLLILVAAVLVLSRMNPNYRVTDWRIVLNAVTGLGAPEANATQPAFSLPSGLALTVYSATLPKARMLRLTNAGDLLVSQPRLGQISLLGRDANGDGLPDRQVVLMRDLDRPNGLDFYDGWLYVAEAGAVGRIRFDQATGATSGSYERILEGIPEGENHWTRTLRTGADGWMYLSIGSSCNVCIEKHDWRAAMIRFKPDGSGAERYASGLRNSVGFDWAPWSGELFATDNGRDLLGDNFPPCELNRIVPGGFYGWPYVNGFGVADPDFGGKNPALAEKALPPAHGFGAHNAPLGITFLRSRVNAVRFGKAAVVALHGSWNRSTPDGYKLALLQWDDTGKIRQTNFLSGFEHGGQVVGRPVDVAEAPDGVLFVSDDYAGAIYRIAPGQQESNATMASAAATRTDISPATHRPDEALAGVSASERQQATVLAQALLTKHACRTCHVPGTALSGKWQNLGARYSVAELSQFFIAPTPPMPVFPLSEAERRALAIHLLAGGGAE